MTVTLFSLLGFLVVGPYTFSIGLFRDYFYNFLVILHPKRINKDDIWLHVLLFVDDLERSGIRFERKSLDKGTRHAKQSCLENAGAMTSPFKCRSFINLNQIKYKYRVK